jgi:hypothetical protein
MTSLILQKPLHVITEVDLQHLVMEKVSEAETLDYKLEMYSQSDADKKEMLRDISSMANHQGGHILIGIREENEVAAEIVGINQPEIAAERLLSSCLTGIHERINGLDALPIPLGNGRAVLAVYIPQSTRMPHAVTFQNEDRFWIRHGRQKMRMSVEEIREACQTVEELAKKVEDFLLQRRQRLEIMASFEAGKNADCAFLRIAATPLIINIDRFDISRGDVRALMEDPPGMRRDGWTVSSSGQHAEPTMYGLKIGSIDFGSLEVFRNGYSEFLVRIEPDSHFKKINLQDDSTMNVLFPLGLVEYTVSMLRFYRSFAELIGIINPIILTWNLFNAHRWGLCRIPELRTLGNYYGPRISPDNNLFVPEIQVSSLSDPDRIARSILDRVWHAYGYEQSPYFDMRGQFTPP